MADDAGALLVRSGLISTDALVLARALAQSEGGSIGEHLVGAEFITDEALTEFYRTRLLVPQVNPNTLARLPENVIAAIPANMAIDLRVIPVSIGDGITIAMGDPSSRVAVDEVSSFTGTYVIRSVATQMQIAWCLAHYYGHVTTLGSRLLQSGAESTGEIVPTPPPSAPRRSRGQTSKVNAARHRAMPPITAQVAVHRPDPSVLDDTSPASEVGEAARPADSNPNPRVRTLTGEIAVSRKRQAVVEPAEDPDSGPVVTIEVSEALMPVRRGANWQDPPELATRSGEVQSKVDTSRAFSEEPAVVIAEEVFAEPLGGRVPNLAEAPVRVRVREDVAIVTSLPSRGQTIRDSAAEREPAVVANAADDAESAPILLTPKRPAAELSGPAVGSAAPSGGVGVPHAVEGEEGSGVVLLAQPKSKGSRPSITPPVASPIAAPSRPPLEPVPEPPRVASSGPEPRQRRPERRTQMGLGIDSVKTVPVTVSGRAARDTEVTIIPSMPVEDDEPEHAAAAPAPFAPPATVAAGAAVAASMGSTSPVATPAPPVAAPPPVAPVPVASPGPVAAPVARQPSAPAPTAPKIDPAPIPPAPAPLVQPAAPGTPVTEATAEAARPSQRAAARSASYSDSVDDGWGPPGSTIPPPWLGAIPGGIQGEAVPGSAIPISDESGPLLMAPPSPPQASSRRNSAAVPVSSTEDLVSELEATTARVIELVRRLDQASDRDQIIELLVGHLAESHARAGFFTIRQGAMTAFRIAPTPAVEPTASLKLDTPSTLQDVVDTRLPYRGPVADELSRQFLTEILGEVPAEILLVPIAVRERAVGVLFADRRKRHTFDEQLAVAARAAGVAFERVVRARRDK